MWDGSHKQSSPRGQRNDGFNSLCRLNQISKGLSYSVLKKIKTLSELEDSHEVGCELQQIEKGKIDYIMEATATIKKEKLLFSKQ